MDFLKACNPNLQNILSDRKETCVTLSYRYAPCLAIVEQTYGRDVAKEWVFQQTVKFLDYCEQQQGVEDDKMLEYAASVINSYPWLTINEYALFLSKARSGRYGQFYGVTGPMQLMQMLKRFEKEREEELRKEDDRLNQERITKQMQESGNVREYFELKKAARRGNIIAINKLNELTKIWKEKLNGVKE